MERFTLNSVPDALSVPFDADTSGMVSEEVNSAIIEAYDNAQTALTTPIYTINLSNNGIVSDGFFYGYQNTIPGDATPIIIPRDSEFTGFTYSNTNSGADYTLIFRKNSTVATPFLSIARVNTQFFNYLLVTTESFTAGDEIYIEHQDDGGNASNAALILNFRVIP